MFLEANVIDLQVSSSEQNLISLVYRHQHILKSVSVFKLLECMRDNVRKNVLTEGHVPLSGGLHNVWQLLSRILVVMLWRCDFAG